ncbi:MAG TPA: hypothetical protein VK209_02470, partial [Candidatus Sulfotelmatobacter sp.]|nr:hypothetical protein [Candidatus Sulfotelmatobacter sp.]
LNNISWPWAAIPGQYVSDVGACVADFNVGIAAFMTRERQIGSGIQMGFNLTAINLVTGEMLPWKVALPDEASYNAGCLIADHGMIIILTQNGYYLAYNLQTGQLVWKSETLPYPWAWNGFGSYEAQSAYGMFFRESYDGIYAFNWTNGKIVWHYEAETLASFESPYITNGTEHYSFNSGALLADGKFYVANSEHSTTWPYTRGWGIHCLNITTGELIWKINNGMSPGGIADGYMIAGNSMDGYTYTFGKGKSVTTVAVNQEIISKGTKIMIKGTIMDISPAQPNTPCVSKDSMRTQMEYLHLQMPIDGLWHNETVTGVPVTLTALGSDGSSINIGTITTDGYYGTFSQTWTPSKEGDYKIIASFAGDDSYGSSSATTAISVGPTPTSNNTGNEQQITVPDYTMTIIGVGIALAVVIVIAVAVAVLILRKK